MGGRERESGRERVGESENGREREWERGRGREREDSFRMSILLLHPHADTLDVMEIVSP